MISDISIGQYYTGNSFLHKMDARIKFILVFALLVFVFLCKSFFSLALMVAFTVFAVILSKVPLRMILKSIKPLVIIILFTALLNIFYT
ncbi:MAG: energy-coupling factor transporter transmembrane protein EcfT, partial [Clostridia bacterium]|nr:energy-coupling factor transporter transmembrane protein EcfT [Clostridia bacterium]